MDALASQRNSVWSFPFMVYFWVTPLVLYLAKDPAPFLTLAGCCVLINFWGHTRLGFGANSRIERVLSWAIIQPEDHFWHHSVENSYCNFATVFNFWDKLHGTWQRTGAMPEKLGFDSDMPLWRKIFFPV